MDPEAPRIPTLAMRSSKLLELPDELMITILEYRLDFPVRATIDWKNYVILFRQRLLALVLAGNHRIKAIAEKIFYRQYTFKICAPTVLGAKFMYMKPDCGRLVQKLEFNCLIVIDTKPESLDGIYRLGGCEWNRGTFYLLSPMKSACYADERITAMWSKEFTRKWTAWQHSFPNLKQLRISVDLDVLSNGPWAREIYKDALSSMEIKIAAESVTVDVCLRKCEIHHPRGDYCACADEIKETIAAMVKKKE